MKFLGMNIYRWDIGGQKTYRDEFINNFEHNIKGTHLILYVLSVQESEYEKESLQFLQDLLEKLKKTSEEPHIGLLLHKLDPNIKKLPKVAKYTNKLENKVRKILEKYPYEHIIFRTSIYDPASCLEAFALMLNSRFPKGEYVTKKIQDICGDLGTTMGMAHAIGGDKNYPFLFGRYIKPGSDLEQAVEFIKTTYSMVDQKNIFHAEEGIVEQPLGQDAEILAKRFQVGNIMTVFSTVQPIGKYRGEESFRTKFNESVDDLQKLLSTIAIGMGLRTVE